MRQLQKGQELADFAVERLAERITQQDFWERLAPQLLAAGVVQHLEAETLIRLETEKAKAQAHIEMLWLLIFSTFQHQIIQFFFTLLL